MSPESERLIAASAVLAAYAVFCGLILWRAARRRRRAAPVAAAGASGVPPMLVAYSSQTGFAEELAQRTATVLQAASVPVQVSDVARLDGAALASAGRALFLVSTTGEGDAPDGAARFVRRVMGTGARLQGLDYGLLALGDSSYAQYCDFGRRLDAWLQAQGARPLFERIEVDSGAVDALQRWQTAVEDLAGAAAGPIGVTAGETFSSWRLVERSLLNPNGIGGPAFRLAFESVSDEAGWQAGDIAVLEPRNAPEAVAALLAATGADPALSAALATRRLPADPSPLAGLGREALLERLPPLPRREYSIASVPEDGRLELVVRQVSDDDGVLGIGSGWLTAHLPPGGEARLRLRPNQAFRAPPQDVPMILIGNGTGIAGLRAHLHARLRAGRRRNWLLFGERSRARDFLCGAEIEHWLADGSLARLDLAFSREAPRRYVQDALRDAGEELRRWVDAGAVIFVCGSMEGMAPGVHGVLVEALGEDRMEALAAEGCYRRDVY